MSLNYFRLRMQGKSKVRDLAVGDLERVRRFIDDKKLNLITRALLPCLPPQGNINLSIKIGSGFKEIAKCTSKEIRESTIDKKPIMTFKFGINMTAIEALNWGSRLSKLTSTKHKNILLRVAHGDVYTKLKLQSFNLIDNNSCPRCGQVEDLRHKFLDCDYVKRIWEASNRYRTKLLGDQYDNLEVGAALFGHNINSNLAILTLNAEVLLRISYLKDDQTFLVHPKVMIRSCIKALIRNEKNGGLKETLQTLLE